MREVALTGGRPESEDAAAETLEETPGIHVYGDGDGTRGAGLLGCCAFH